MESTALSIIIVNWNTSIVTCNCLASIYEQVTIDDYEIIVIDNASSDDSVISIKSNYPHVKLIVNNENRGFAAANNQGIEVARGQYILLLNSDTIILKDAILKTLEFAGKHPQYAVVGCQVWEDENTIQKTCFRFHNPWNFFCVLTGLARLFPGSRWLGGDKMQEWDRKSDREVDVVSGMFMLVRREVIQTIGYLDESFFIYAEEADWCYRMYQAGWRNYFWTGARIIHLDGGSKSSAQVNVKMEVQKVKSLLILIRKHYGWLAEQCVRLIVCMSASFKWLLLAMVFPFASKKIKPKLPKFAGIISYCCKGIFPGLSI